MVTWTKEDLRAHEMKAAKPHNIAVTWTNSGPLPCKVEFAARASSDEAKLNKLERAYLLHLRCCGLDPHIQAITLKLAGDTRYTCDFAHVCNGRMVFDEVKGFMRDDARVKLRVAARMFPEFTFRLVHKSAGCWDIEEIKP